MLSFSYLIVALQDRISKKIFGKGYERDGLYYFGDPPCENVMTSSFQTSVLPNFKLCVFSAKTLHLWHARLRHVNSQYLCFLFPLLKQACHDCHFKCVVCELSKHTRSSYLPCIYHTSTAFHIIHSDVWGPLSVYRYV